ncbi:MAG: hypothetical protein IJC36_01765, partial [Clostridia bacterium]|nr:hypothetical protein [Clostridia bacterium]
NGIHLIGCNRLSILANMQPLAVNHFCNLLRSHSSVTACKAAEYGFFYFHIISLYFAKSSENVGFDRVEYSYGFHEYRVWHYNSCC